MNATQYNRINELLAEHSKLSAALEAAEGEIKTVQLAAAEGLLPGHASLTVRLTDLESELRKQSDLYFSELFPEDKRSHKTPFGELSYHKSSSLEFDDEEKVLLKIKLACATEEDRAIKAEEPPRFTLAQLIRTSEEPNLDAMGTFDDSTLAIFGIRREHKDTFKVKPFAMKTDKPAKAEKKTKLKEAA